jgi:hypothetical protein
MRSTTREQTPETNVVIVAFHELAKVYKRKRWGSRELP